MLWGDVLVDGHNCYGICKKHGLPFQTVQNTRFQSMEDVHLWMIDQHLGRRSVSTFSVACWRCASARSWRSAVRRGSCLCGGNAEPETQPEESLCHRHPGGGQRGAPEDLSSREAIARAARLSSTRWS